MRGDVGCKGFERQVLIVKCHVDRGHRLRERQPAGEVEARPGRAGHREAARQHDVRGIELDAAHRRWGSVGDASRIRDHDLGTFRTRSLDSEQAGGREPGECSTGGEGRRDRDQQVLLAGRAAFPAVPAMRDTPPR